MGDVLTASMSVSPIFDATGNEARFPAFPVQARDASTATPFARGSSVDTQAAPAVRFNVSAKTVEPTALGFMK